MRLLLPIILLFLVITSPLAAAINFPALSGRVVDDAHILSQSALDTLTQQLEDYERGTSNQVVVATIKSLDGNSIEEYGYQLGRYWQIGQQGKNNGALLIVAPNERKVRIEVGYGLEGILTDAITSQIIQQIILPDFRSGNMEKGIISGTEAIITILGGKSVPALNENEEISIWQVILIWIFMILFIRFALRHPFLAASLISSTPARFGSSRYSGWSGSSRGFSGGGGSFGGGGTSGSW
jgi:uncharacterized protein